MNDLALAYETGAHIGDGCCTISKNGSYAVIFTGNLTTDYDYFCNILAKIIEKLYEVKPKIVENSKKNSISLVIYSKELIDFKTKNLKLPLGKKEKMRGLPEVITKYGENSIKHMIGGIFDTDGCFKTVRKEGKLYPRITIKNKSGILTEIRNFLVKKNIPCNINQDKRTLVNCLYINGNRNTDNFFELIKSMNKKHLNKYDFWLKMRDNQEYIRACSLVRTERLASEFNSLKKPICSL